jgi:sugar/nucleoside kinase (ribokinase family)
MGTDQRKGIACGGNWIIDLVKVVDLYPPESALANILRESQGGGGCAHNVTLNLAKFDSSLDLYALGVIGNDPNGDTLLAECYLFPNIHTDQLHRTDHDRTSYTDVFNVQSTGRRTFFHYRGANRLFAPCFVDLDRLPVRLFHLGYLLLLDAMDQADPQFKTVAARFLHEVQKRGIQTSIDLVSEDSDRFSRIVPASLKYTNYCIINDFEAERISSLPIRRGSVILTENLRRIGQALFAYGVNDLVVIHFPEGAYLMTSDGTEIIQPSLDLPETYIVGSTGAGDSFCAGVLYGLYKHWPLDEALRFATCAGGMNLSDLTTIGGIRSWPEVLEMQRRFPFRKDVAQ